MKIKLTNETLPFSESMALIGAPGIGKSTVFNLFYLPHLVNKYKYGVIINFYGLQNCKAINRIINKNFIARWLFNKCQFGSFASNIVPVTQFITKKNKQYVVITIEPTQRPEIKKSFFESIINSFKGDCFISIDDAILANPETLDCFKNIFVMAQSEQQLEHFLGKNWKERFSLIAEIQPKDNEFTIIPVC